MLLRLTLSLLLCSAAYGQVRSLTILHLNDLHARLLPDTNQQGGFAHVATAIRRERENCTACLVLNAGDLVQGTPVSTLFKGLPAYEISNLLGIDVGTLGNHEFDYGWQMTQRFLRMAKYPIVSANVADDKGRLITGKAYVVRNIGGIRVAVIGALMTNVTEGYSTSDLVGPWRALPVVESVTKYAREVRDRADLIVVLGHLREAEDREVLRSVSEMQVFVSGHGHEGIEAPEIIDGRIRVTAQGYGREIGRLDLEVNVPEKRIVSSKWKKIAINARLIPPAPDVAALVAKWESQVSKLVDVPIGEAQREISQKEGKVLLERIMRDETGADFAFMNSGGVRDRFPKGRLLARHVWNVMPFDNIVVVGKFRGDQLPAVVLDGAKVDPNRVYTLALTDFTAANQRTQLRTTNLSFPAKGPLLRDLMIQWIRKKRVIE